MSQRVLLLSIRPEFAEKVFNGTKRVELRRTRPRISTGDLVYVYVSSPMKALVGMFEVKTVISGFIPELWHQVQHTCGITYDQFSKYYAGARQGFGITISDSWFLPRPLGLNYLREQWTNFWPPQGYRYLSTEEVQRVQLLTE